MVHGLSCSAACGILPDQGSNRFPLHWQADSQPLRHKGSPKISLFLKLLLKMSGLIGNLILFKAKYNSFRIIILIAPQNPMILASN